MAADVTAAILVCMNKKHFPPLPKIMFSCKFCEESDLENIENVLSTNMTSFMWLQTKNIGLRTLLAREERSLSRFYSTLLFFFYVFSFFLFFYSDVCNACCWS